MMRVQTTYVGRRASAVAVLAVLLVCCAVAFGQTYLIPWSSVNSGGEPGTGTGMMANGSAGQAVQGEGTATGYKGYWGFWYGVGKKEELPPGWVPGWQEVKSMPNTPTDKAPKDGAWMALHAAGTDANPVIYVAKGNKATDFYMYDPLAGDSGTWYEKKPIPGNEGTKLKPPSKGCVGVSDGVQYVYMTKGNNTLGFWRYDAVANTWDSMPGVPEGPYGKRVKGGTDMVFASYKDTGCVYLLKGYKTEFYRYNPVAGRWDTLPEVPYGGNAKKYDKGSFL
ncbi:MAG: hypothetical protein ABIL25_07195, partial [candidate division WOR-3 bacterium]